MSSWTSLEGIMRDLAVAQGGFIPGDLVTFSGDGPPTLHIEEEGFEGQTYLEGEGGDIPPPDLKLIQHMIDLVKEKENKEDDTSDLSTDLDPSDPEFILLHMQTQTVPTKTARWPVSRDIIPIMFRQNVLKLSEEGTEKVLPSQPSSPKEECKQYKPSPQACAIYAKYLERSELKEKVEEDIWAQAERKMKIIEARKKAKAALDSPKDIAMFELLLPEHRHNMPGDCVVCIVAAKHGYCF